MKPSLRLVFFLSLLSVAGMSAGTTASSPEKFNLHYQVSIPMRDGVKLSATLYLPKAQAAPGPVIFFLNPYTTDEWHKICSYLTASGYTCMVVDSRGRGNSEGVWRPFNVDDAPDGFDVVEWIAKQPFCNGKVAMHGASYVGYTQWAAAKELPPHLVSITPEMSAAPAVDTIMGNNITFPYMLRYLQAVTGRTNNFNQFSDAALWGDHYAWLHKSGKPYREWDSLLGNPSPTFQEWLDHPTQDAYWDKIRPTPEQFGRIDLPILAITGCYDGNQPGTLYYYREHLRHASADAMAKHFLVIGPWDHGGPNPKLDVYGIKYGPAALLDKDKLAVEWFDWTLRDGPKPKFLRKNVAYYVMGAEKWRYADALAEVTAKSKALYLSSTTNATHVFNSGVLQSDVSRGGSDSYEYDPLDTRIAEVELAGQTEAPWAAIAWKRFGLTDQSSVFASEGNQLIYHSDRFPEDTEISGFFELKAWISIDQPDTDFSVTVYEILPDGSSIQLAEDMQRARYRQGLHEEKLIRTTEPLEYHFRNFTFISRQVKKGSRLRLVIGPFNSTYAQRNYNGGGVVANEGIEDAKPVKVVLWHDEKYPSALYVPLGRATSPDEPSAPAEAFQATN